VASFSGSLSQFAGYLKLGKFRQTRYNPASSLSIPNSPHMPETASLQLAKQLIAQAFGDLAARAEKIGQLSISPELLQGLLQPKPEKKRN